MTVVVTTGVEREGVYVYDTTGSFVLELLLFVLPPPPPPVQPPAVPKTHSVPQLPSHPLGQGVYTSTVFTGLGQPQGMLIEER